MIQFKNVSKVYPNGTSALNDVNINIGKGEFVFMVGASGAGKSTFLKLIMKEEEPTSGTIIVNGEDITHMKRRKVPYLRRTMGIVFQDFRLIDKMSVFDNVAFAMRVIGARPAAVKKRVNYILGLVGLRDKAQNRPAELSGGEQQRVSLARALVNNPTLIIADEPTGNIDPEMSFEIIELLNEINKQGTTIIVVTHEHELVHRFKNRVIEIQDGKIASDSGVTAEKAEVPIEISEEDLQKIPDEIAEEIPDVSTDEINREALLAIGDEEADDE
ncbi:MAG: cell division ATP-binding protein FtsE [Clostridia bacterium]|nr:cell division ATP-binding protein FtsE [Clostridia bacterium]